MEKPKKAVLNKKTAYYGERERIFLFNTIVEALNIIYEAAVEGSPDAHKFMRGQAEIFIQKAGGLS